MVLSVSKYFALAKADFFEKLNYFGTQVFSSFFICLVIFIFFNIWTAIYAGKGIIEGFTIAQMLWYLGVAELIVMSSQLRWIETISEEVRTGIVASMLLKPINYVFSKLVLHMSNFLYGFFTSGFFVIFVVYYLAGPIDVLPRAVVFSFISIIFGTLLNFVILACLGFIAFWIEDSHAIFWIYQKGLFILGGMLIPLDVYPEWIKGAIINLPFSFIIYNPAKLFIQFNFLEFLRVLFWQLGYIALFSVILFVIYQIGIRRLQINGG